MINESKKTERFSYGVPMVLGGISTSQIQPLDALSSHDGYLNRKACSFDHFHNFSVRECHVECCTWPIMCTCLFLDFKVIWEMFGLSFFVF